MALGGWLLGGALWRHGRTVLGSPRRLRAPGRPRRIVGHRSEHFGGVIVFGRFMGRPLPRMTTPAGVVRAFRRRGSAITGLLRIPAFAVGRRALARRLLVAVRIAPLHAGYPILHLTPRE